MNRIYRLVFNSALRQVQVASEAASGGRIVARGRRTQALDRPRLKPLVLALALAWAGGAQAQVLPSNPVVVQGTVSIANTPNTLQVTQTGNRALINWSNFSIGQSDAVNFITNNPSAVTLNVVIGNLASQIDGVLNSDGHVFLINPNGITFGGNARVNVAGLLATTLSLQDPNVPIYDFRRGAHPGAAVLNHGQINANGGPVLLAGAAVGNYGTIQGGHIGLVAADRMMASYDPAAGMSYYIVDAVDDALLGPGPVLVNTGTLQASQVNLLARVPTGSSAIALNMGGVIVADTLVANAGGGALAVGANIQATQTSLISDGSLQQTGGSIDTNTLALQTGGGASLNASGNTISFIEGSVGTNLVLGNNRALSQLGALSVGGDATFNNGPHAITLSNANNTFSGGVRLEGGTTTIASNGVLKLRAAEVQSLTASATGIELNGFFGSTSDQAYNGDVSLTGNASLSSSAGNITFNGSVNGGGNLRVDAKDEVRFGGIVGGAARLGSVEVVSGDAILNGSVYTWGMQRYADAVRLGGSVSLSSSLGSDIVFGSTIDGAYNLLVQTDGTTRFGGTIGGSSALATLRQDGGTFELGANVNTIGLQTYEKVKLVGDVNAASLGGGDIRFDGAVNGGHALATSTTGQTYFTGSVGGLDALTSLTAGGGGVTLLGGNVTTTGNQHYLDAAVLVGNSTLTSTGSGTIQFSKRLDGNFNLAVNTAGQSIFDGTVGFYTPLLSFSSDLPGSTRIGTQFRSVGGIVFNDILELGADTVVTSTTGSVRFGNMISGGGWDLRVGGATGTRFDNDVQANMLTVEGNGTTTLAGDVTVADTAQFNRPVLLAGDVAVSGQSVVFGGSIDGGHALDITAAAVNVAGHIGGGTPLASLAVDAGTLALSGTVTTSGALSLASTGNLVQVGAFQAGGPASFQSDGDITLLNTGNQFSGDVALSGQNVAITGQGDLSLSGVNAQQLSATSPGRLTLRDASSVLSTTLRGGQVLLDNAALGASSNVAATNTGITQQGAVSVGGASTWMAATDVVLLNPGNRFGGRVDIDAASANISSADRMQLGTISTSGNLKIDADAGLRLDGQISAANVDLATAGIFDNGAGSSAITLSGPGRWHVYLASPSRNHAFGGLDSGNTALWNTAAFGATATTGNRYLFAFQPTLSISANSLRKNYGDSIDLSDAFSVSGAMGGVTGAYRADLPGNLLSGTPSLFSAGAAGTASVMGSPYAISISRGSQDAGTSGYALAFVDGQLQVDPRSLTITANNGGKTYGQTGGLAGFSSNGLVNGDTVSSVDLGSAGAAATATVGDYTITASNADGTGLSNYAITYVDGTLSIGKAGLTITANNSGKTYGQVGGLNGFSSNGLLNGDTVSSVNLGSTGAAATANIGDYTITASNADGTGLANYDITYVDGTLSIGKAGLTITANTGGKTYGQTGGLAGFTSNGLVNGDRVSSVDLGSTGAAATANIGDYTITASNADGTGLANYDITYVDGTLSIGKAGLIITANSGSKNTGQFSALHGYTAHGLVNGDTIDTLTLSSSGADVGAKPGPHAIFASDARGERLGNYEITYRAGTLDVAGVSTSQGAQVAREIAGNLQKPATRALAASADGQLYELTSTAIPAPSDSCSSQGEIICLTRQPE